MKDDFFRRRLLDLATQSERTNHFTFTSFLTEAELSEFHAVSSSLPNCGTAVWGGREDAERVMLRFGSTEALGYEEAFPIACLKITPLQVKFAEQLTHRDVLGAVIHLGIERSEIGDILIDQKTAYLFCSNNMAAYLCQELCRIRHTSVSCVVTEQLPDKLETHLQTETIQVSSARLDGIIAKAYHISRGDCNGLFAAKRVFVNSVCTENNSYQLKPEDKISVRGYGKLRYLGVTGTTRKGNLLISLERFV